MSFHRQDREEKKDEAIEIALEIKVPSEVSFQDVNADGSLTTASEMKTVNDAIERIKKQQKLEEKKGYLRFSKKDLGSTYGQIQESEEKTYSVYKGSKHNKALGKGGYGKVKLLQCNETKEWYTLKVPFKTAKQVEQSAKAESSQLNSVGMTQTKEVITRIRTGTNPQKHSSGSANVNIIMNYIPGKNLLDYIADKKMNLSERECFEIATGMINAIIELHKQNKIHCDIKLENFIYDFKTGKVSYIDVGSVVDLKDQPVVTKANFGGSTAGYRSPEIEDKFEFSIQSDIYALGKTLRDLLGFRSVSTKEDIRVKNPYEEKQLTDIDGVIQAMERKLIPPVDKTLFGEDAKKNISNKPRQRMPLDQVYHFLNIIKPSNAEIKKVCIIELDKLDFKDKKNMDLLALDQKAFKDIDEVVFVLPKPPAINHKQLLWARESFEKFKTLSGKPIAVRNEVLTTNDIGKIPEKMNALDSKRGIINQCYHFSKEHTLKLLPQNFVSNEDINNLKEKINIEKTRLNQKYAKKSGGQLNDYKDQKNENISKRYSKLLELENFLDTKPTYLQLSEQLKIIEPEFLKYRSLLPKHSVFKKKTEFSETLETIQSEFKKRIG